MNNLVITYLNQYKIVPIVNVTKLNKFKKLINLFEDNGVKLVELVFRSDLAEDALKWLNNHIKESGSDIIYGTGTVRTIDQLKSAINFGAKFIFAPGLNTELLNSFFKIVNSQKDSIFIPGVDSTLGIEMAISLDLKVLKVFPISIIGGIKWLKAILGPYYDLKFIPSGGISLKNLSDYLSLRNVVACSGSFLAPKKLIDNEEWLEISNIINKAQSIVEDLNGL